MFNKETRSSVKVTGSSCFHCKESIKLDGIFFQMMM